jgi:acetyl-CoA synthetase
VEGGTVTPEDGPADRLGRLDRLLRPRSVAVIGGREAEKVAKECLRVGFEGPIYPVSRSRQTMAGIPAYGRLEELPEAPDAAFVAIPPEAAIEAAAVLNSMGAGGAVVYTSGFAERGEAGSERQHRLLVAAGGMALLGPNCYGLVNYFDGVALWPDDHGGERVERGAAIVSQSGNVAISLTMQERSLPLGFVASLGNQAKDGVPQVMRALLHDPRVSAIGLFIETVGDVPAFRAAALQAARQGVPVVALKTGRSEASARVALSHTSSLAGSAAAFDALCDRLAVVRAETLPDFLETLKFLHRYPGLPGRRVVSISCSGGEAGLMADTAQRTGVALPPFPSDSAAALHDVLGEGVAIDNPLDYHTYIWGDADGMRRCYTAALSHTGADAAVLALDTPDRPELDLFGWPEAEQGIIDAAAETGLPTIVASSLPENSSRAQRARFIEAGLVPILGFEEALQAIDRAAWYADARSRALTHANSSPALGLRTGPSAVLDEWRSKRLLAGFGLPVPEGALVASPTEAVAAAEAIGYPIALKACSAALAHKTEVGGVALNLGDAAEVDAAATRMASLSDRWIVEAMARDPVAELIVGITRDPLIGPVLMLGAGGILAEIIKDSVLLVPPVDAETVGAALDRLSVAPLLAGYRGRPPADRPALIEAVLAIARFAEAHADRLEELDVNPLMALPEGAVAADALIRWIKDE